MLKSVIESHQQIVDSAKEKGITLDGKPAKVCGVRLAYAIITPLDNSGASYQWSWKAVERIIKRDGKFNS